ncbi:MAG: hypothetical protein EZS28_012417 [Streblomastix strix]|uniref:TmcB/TmcC TPR repeats domain-containing protein n=1 Tax=Streblomastix strix TaxID=222440 RepID=A0A5J4WCG1_9EUKA|nr:MAG: hypothetical protein EZS28_012417 [Streblomastix strix]
MQRSGQGQQSQTQFKILNRHSSQPYQNPLSPASNSFTSPTFLSSSQMAQLRDTQQSPSFLQSYKTLSSVGSLSKLSTIASTYNQVIITWFGESIFLYAITSTGFGQETNQAKYSTLLNSGFSKKLRDQKQISSIDPKKAKELNSSFSSLIKLEDNEEDLPETIPYYIPKIKRVSQIDAAVRFVWSKNVRKRKDYVHFADYIYKIGLQRFPRHPSLRIHYALFLCHYMKDWEAAMQQMAIAHKIGATIDNRWIIFYMFKVYEQKNSGADLKSADVLSLFRYKNHLSQAEANHREARNKLINILGMLSQDDDDVMKISSLLDELIDNEKAAEEHYKALLESHPFSIPVLRGYASLLTDVFRKDTEAEPMYQKANDVEGKVGSRKTNQGGSEEDLKSKTDYWFYVLKYVSPFSVVLFLGLGVGLFLTGLNNTNVLISHINLLDDIGYANKLVNELAYYTKLFDIHVFHSDIELPYDYYLDLSEIRERMLNQSNKLHEVAVSGIFQKQSQFLDWQGTLLTTFITMHNKQQFKYQWDQTQTLVEAVNNYGQQIYMLSELYEKLDQDQIHDIVVDTLLNGPTAIDQSLKEEVVALVQALAGQNQSTLIIAIVLGVLGATSTLIIVFIVYILLTRLNTQRNTALNFFLSMRKEVLEGFQDRMAAGDGLDRRAIMDNIQSNQNQMQMNMMQQQQQQQSGINIQQGGMASGFLNPNISQLSLDPNVQSQIGLGQGSQIPLSKIQNTSQMSLQSIPGQQQASIGMNLGLGMKSLQNQNSVLSGSPLIQSQNKPSLLLDKNLGSNIQVQSGQLISIEQASKIKPSRWSVLKGQISVSSMSPQISSAQSPGLTPQMTPSMSPGNGNGSENSFGLVDNASNIQLPQSGATTMPARKLSFDQPQRPSFIQAVQSLSKFKRQSSFQGGTNSTNMAIDTLHNFQY